MNALYITSKIDNTTYCKTNGQFSRHLKLNGYTHQSYYETYITGVFEKCPYCTSPKTFYPANCIYGKTCGKPACVGIEIKHTKLKLTDADRKRDSENKKAASAKKTTDDIKQQQDKARKTNLERYGNEYSFASDVVKNKSIQTKLDRYGDANWNNSRKASTSRFNRSDDDKAKSIAARKTTNMERHGVENPLLARSFISKSNKSNALVKSYAMPSCKVVGIMGYEHIALDILLKIYDEEDIVVHDNYTNTVVEQIEYVAVNRHHLKYYPDIYIKSTNTIIEVKSQWWWDGHSVIKYASRLENNIRKRNAALAAGYNYQVWLFTTKYQYRILCNDDDF